MGRTECRRQVRVPANPQPIAAIPRTNARLARKHRGACLALLVPIGTARRNDSQFLEHGVAQRATVAIPIGPQPEEIRLAHGLFPELSRGPDVAERPVLQNNRSCLRNAGALGRPVIGTECHIFLQDMQAMLSALDDQRACQNGASPAPAAGLPTLDPNAKKS